MACPQGAAGLWPSGSGPGSGGPTADMLRTVAVPGAAGARIGLRHVWVQDRAASARRWPGVLTGWRRDAEGRWVALVAYAVRDANGTVLITAWLRADQLSPAGPG